MFAGHGLAELKQFIALKLDQFLALFAVKMVVLRITIIVFINGPSIQLESS